jgi:hypothetical protein
MIVVRDGQVRSTSRAAERGEADRTDECYHHACYTQAHGEDPILK